MGEVIVLFILHKDQWRSFLYRRVSPEGQSNGAYLCALLDLGIGGCQLLAYNEMQRSFVLGAGVLIDAATAN